MDISKHAIDRLQERFNLDTCDIRNILSILNNPKACRQMQGTPGAAHWKFKYRGTYMIAVVSNNTILTFKYEQKRYRKLQSERGKRRNEKVKELVNYDKRMSSYEIAELTSKQHSHIMRDIRKQLFQQGINESIYGSVKKDTKGQDRPMFNLDYEQTMILITGYSIPLRSKVVKRWQELESGQPALPNFNNPAEAARAWANEFEQKTIAENKVKELQPKAKFYDQVTSSKDAIDIGSAAKVLNIPKLGRNKLFELLRAKNILMANNQPYQKYIDNGYFRTIEQKYIKPDGSVNISIKTVVYQKGLDYIRKVAER